MVLPVDEDFTISLNGVPVVVKMLGSFPGHLNVDTGRGEVKAFSGDFVCTLASGRKFVLPRDAGQMIALNSEEACEGRFDEVITLTKGDLMDDLPANNLGAKDDGTKPSVAEENALVTEAQRIEAEKEAERKRKLDEQLAGFGS